MASKKKQSEGIALLSMYNDEDDEMDDVEEERDDKEDATSPEPEEGEVGSSGHAMFGAELQTANGSAQESTPTAQATPHTSEHPEPAQLDTMSNAMELETTGSREAIEVSEEPKHVDPLDNFLAPPPKEKCPIELQEKINRFLNLKKAGKSFNAEVRKRKDYRNPDFLLHAVRYQDIDQIGSCFSTAVFNPHGYDPSDYYDEIEADMKREMERKEQERKKSQKVEFVSGGNQPPAGVAAQKINIPLPGVPSMATTGLSSVPTAADTAMRDGRQNKKSKWDKVDTGPINPLTSGSQDSISKVGAHAVLLSAANAGAGYMAFAQQRRREAEEKRSGEKKTERRT